MPPAERQGQQPQRHGGGQVQDQSQHLGQGQLGQGPVREEWGCHRPGSVLASPCGPSGTEPTGPRQAWQQWPPRLPKGSRHSAHPVSSHWPTPQAPKPPSHLTPPPITHLSSTEHQSPTAAADQPAGHQRNVLTICATLPPVSPHPAVCPSIPATNHPTTYLLSAAYHLPFIHSTSHPPIHIHPIHQPPTQHIQLPICHPLSHPITIHLPVPPQAHPVHRLVCTICQAVGRPSIHDPPVPTFHPSAPSFSLLPTRPFCPVSHRLLSHSTHCARLSTREAPGVPPPSVPPHGGQAQPLQGRHDHVDVIVASAQEAAMGIQPGVWGQPGWGGSEPETEPLQRSRPPHKAGVSWGP